MGAANTGDLELTNSAAVASEDGDGIRLERGVEGDVTVDNSASVSGRWHGVYVGEAARIDFDHSAGTIAGRTGVYLEVTSESGAGDSRATDSNGDHDPVIDVDWTGGSIARGTAANDNGRFRAVSAAQVLAFDQEAAAVKAVAGTVHYGGAAGIEAHALSWRDVVEQVAQGDDPGAIADNTAQMNLLSTSHADSQRAAILAQFRAALGNDDLAVAAAVLTAIDSTATSVSDLSDAEIVTYLSTDNAATRTLLRNILAQGLTDDEKSILRAVATNDDVDATLTAAGFSDDTSDPNDYWSLVKALLDRHHLDDISIDMTAGSIDSRGDGIRAYYATPHGSNGAIEVTVGAGASVAGGTAGIFVANAPDGLTLARKYTYNFAMGQMADTVVSVAYNGASLLKQVVTVAGTVTGGTDAAVRLGGGAVIVEEGGSVRAGSSGVGILADGPALVYVDGEVRGGAGGAAAVHLKGGGTVTVGLNGRVRANGATHAIQRDGTVGTTRLTLITESSRLTEMVPYRDDLIAQVEGSLSGIDSARLIGHLNGVPTGYSLPLTLTADGMLDTSKFPSRRSFDCSADGPCRITPAGTISGRTGVYAAVPSASTMAPGQPPLIDVAWTATFSQGAAGEAGRFTAETARDALTFDQESAAVKVAEETIRWGAPAGIEAHALSWRDVAAQVAKGDDPGAFANNAAQLTAVPTGATVGDNAYVAQFRAALENGDLTVAPTVLTAIGTTATTAATDLTDAQIVTYLQADDVPTRALLRNIPAQRLSEAEAEVLKAVAAGDGDGLDAALTAAGFSDDTSDPNDYWSLVKALLDRYNVGDIRIKMTAGSIDSRGDGIRAYYATPHDSNGGIDVTVGAGASVTGGTAGVYVANAGPGGLTLKKKYTPGYAEGDDPDERVAAMHGEGADAVPLLNQIVTVAGMVTGGTDAAVHLSGGGAVIVEKGGRVHAGASGVAILVNDPGPALVYVDGEVKGGEDGAAAVHLTGGGSVVIDLNGNVEANGATRAIRGGGDAATEVDVDVATARMIAYREDAEEAVNARLKGSLENVGTVRFREHRNGTFTGYGPTLPVDTETGMLDTSGLASRSRLDAPPRPRPPGLVDPRDPETGDPRNPETGDPRNPETGDPRNPETGDPRDPETGDPRGPETGDPRGPETGDPRGPETGDPRGPETGDPRDPETGDPRDPGMGPGTPTPTFSCAGAMDGRCRLYEALPSMLLTMNAPPSYAERTSAARGAHGGWARVEAARGTWQAEKATRAGTLAYDHHRSMAHAGIDFIAGESARVGASMHALRGRAEMAGVGEAKLNGMGGGLSATWLSGGFYVDAQAAVTLYDVDVESYTHGRMTKKDVSGAGYALAADMGKRLPMGGMFVTPRAGLVWSKVDLSDFTDMERAGGPRARVAPEGESSVKGRLGVMLETEMGSGDSALFGSLDVEREFSDGTAVKIGEEVLKTEVRPTAVRLGLGGAFKVDGNTLLRATAGYRRSGSGMSEYSGGLELRVQF